MVKGKLMEENKVSLTALDQMVSGEQSQLLKAVIPYLPPKGQQLFSIYAKAMEFINTMAVFSSPKSMQMCAAVQEEPLEMLQNIRSCCYGESRQKLDKIANLMTMAQIVSIMQEEPKGEDVSYGSGLEEQP